MKNCTTKLLPVLLLLETCVPIPVPAQTDGQMKAIMTVVGASTEEELDGQEVEGLMHYISIPWKSTWPGEGFCFQAVS